MRTVTTLFLLLDLIFEGWEDESAHQRVRLPVSWSSWIRGVPGITVGMGAMPVVVAMAGKLSKSGTIMVRLEELKKSRELKAESC